MAIRASAKQGSAMLPAMATTTSAPSLRPSKRPRTHLNAVPKKLNTLQEDWSKKFFGTGYFLEDQEKTEVNALERLEKKKVLSTVEKSGLLSLMEKLGFSLTLVERLGLLSLAEKLGLLSTVESVMTTEPGVVASLSIPLFVLSIVALVLIPEENMAETVLRYGVAGALGVGASACFIGAFVLGALQDDD